MDIKTTNKTFQLSLTRFVVLGVAVVRPLVSLIPVVRGRILLLGGRLRAGDLDDTLDSVRVGSRFSFSGISGDDDTGCAGVSVLWSTSSSGIVPSLGSSRSMTCVG